MNVYINKGTRGEEKTNRTRMYIRTQIFIRVNICIYIYIRDAVVVSGERAKKRFTRLRRLCVRRRGEGLLCRRRFRRSRFRIKYLRAKEVINFFHFSFHGVVFLLFNASSNTATTESPATLAPVYTNECATR